ncbi:MAG: hypothetical protein CMD96_07130 [Gammaproteobacteria bacterium]|jgi:hypothetical protein|nr:hypothetical protein [Gammaproteobacteria bacterium]HJP17955.1 hypothetical protein [Nitrospinota bacterium]|tara:strand:+ start:1102 stop:1806 length:705 start_codon:yes stop_codon:yes gene_type:complete
MQNARKRKKSGLVEGHLERISSKAFEDYLKQMTNLVKTKHGVYALYKKDRLYYIGLATDLHRRVKYHLRDKHANKWDRFSLYLVKKADHIRDLESLVVRIAEPRGNKVKGKLVGSADLGPQLKERIKKHHDQEMDRIFGENQGRKKIKSKAASKYQFKSVQGILKLNTRLIGKYKGKTYKAIIRSKGKIELNGKLFDSPSGAAKSIVKRAANGWNFWKCRDKDGNWKRLKEFRK